MASERALRKADELILTLEVARQDYLDVGPILAEALAAERIAGMEEAANIAGGWTGKINTVKNCAVVSEVCRGIGEAIRAAIEAEKKGQAI